MSMVKLVCTVCGKEFITDVDNFSVLGLKNLPKRCPECADKRAGLQKTVLERQMLKEYFVTTESVMCTLQSLEKEPETKQNEQSQYFVFSMGGRAFGRMGGAGFDEKYLIFVHKDLINSTVARVRLMKKVVEREKQTFEHLYIAIDPAIEINSEIGFLVIYPKKIWKTTLKGFGRQWKRNYVLIGEYDVLLSTSSYARSYRFGNIYELCYVRGSYDIEEHCTGDC